MGAKPSTPLAPPPPPPPLVSDGALMLLTLVAAPFALLVRLAPPTDSGLSPRRVFSLSACLLAASTLMLSAVEGLSAVDAFYLTAMTFTTIGYGDLPHPASAAGRVLVSLLALGGVAFFAVTIELFHSIRQQTDGALLGAIGMFGVNLLCGVALCQLLTEDGDMPTSYLDGAYWSVITTTSVGFGDFHPTTDLGKIVVCAYAFIAMQATANAMDLAKQGLMSLCTAPAKRD